MIHLHEISIITVWPAFQLTFASSGKKTAYMGPEFLLEEQAERTSGKSTYFSNPFRSSLETE